MTFFSFRLAWPLLSIAALFATVIFCLCSIRLRCRSLAFPSSRPLFKLPRTIRLRLRLPLFYFLTCVIIICGLLAAGRPQILSSRTEDLNARNIMLVVDLSKSMLTRDFVNAMGKESRIEGVKTVASEFVRNRLRDRIGLIIFGTDVFLKIPLTPDHNMLLQALQSITAGEAGDRTALGDAIAHAIKRIRDVPARASAIILVTDGVNTAGTVEPLQASSIARDLGIKIHVIGIGSDSSRGKPNQDETRSHDEFDEVTLKQIASLSSGQYFNALGIEGLRDVYREIDLLEKSDSSVPERPVSLELFPFVAGICAASWLILFLLSHSYLRRLP